MCHRARFQSLRLPRAIVRHPRDKPRQNGTPSENQDGNQKRTGAAVEGAGGSGGAVGGAGGSGGAWHFDQGWCSASATVMRFAGPTASRRAMKSAQLAESR